MTFATQQTAPTRSLPLAFISVSAAHISILYFHILQFAAVNILIISWYTFTPVPSQSYSMPPLIYVAQQTANIYIIACVQTYSSTKDNVLLLCAKLKLLLLNILQNVHIRHVAQYSTFLTNICSFLRYFSNNYLHTYNKLTFRSGSILLWKNCFSPSKQF